MFYVNRVYLYITLVAVTPIACSKQLVRGFQALCCSIKLIRFDCRLHTRSQCFKEGDYGQFRWHLIITFVESLGITAHCDGRFLRYTNTLPYLLAYCVGDTVKDRGVVRRNSYFIYNRHEALLAQFRFEGLKNFVTRSDYKKSNRPRMKTILHTVLKF